MVHVSKLENNIITQEKTKQTKTRSRQHPTCVAVSMSWQARVKETELSEAHGCNNKTDGSRDCVQHAQLPNKVGNAVANQSTFIRVDVFISVLFYLSVLIF